MSVKTIAVRIGDDLHAQFKLVADMNGHTFVDEIRTALQIHIASYRSVLLGRASELRAQLDAEYDERRKALDAIVGGDSTGTESDG